MKKIYLLLLSLCVGISAGATINGYMSLMLNYKDGRQTIVSLEDNMLVKVADGNVTMTSAKGSVVAPTAALNNWKYNKTAVEDKDNGWTEIDDVNANAMKITMGSDNIVISNAPAGALINVVSIDGKSILSDRASDGYYEIATSGLRGGIYVLTINKESYKIAVK